jgi:hypothetical protein
VSQVHPPSKIFSALLGGLSEAAGTSAAARKLCLDLAGTLIRRQGLSVASGMDSAALVAQVAHHLHDRESTVKAATSDMLTLLEARIGHKELVAMVPDKLRSAVLEVLTQKHHQQPAQVDAHVHATLHHPHRDSWNAIRAGDENAVVEAIKVVCGDLDALAEQKGGADGTVREITGRLWPSRPADSMRVRKYLVNGLLTIVSHRACSLRVEQSSISAVISSVLGELSAMGSAEASADRQSFLKALNVMMFRLLENCRPQSTCAVLVSQLTASIEPQAPSDYVPSKFSDLAMKCLVKLTKGLATTDPATAAGGFVGWDDCIRAVDEFLTRHPPSVWKTRGNDVPLKVSRSGPLWPPPPLAD